MARRKDDGLTTRQRQSQQIMKQKAALKKRQALFRKLRIGGLVLGSLVALSGSIWGWKSGFVERSVGAITDSFYAMTVRSGFAVQAMYLEGRNRTPMAEIDQALGIKKGDPILRLSLDEARANLEKIESVRFAAVERALPGAVYVRIIEREPVAMWQNNGKMSLVDDNGIIMSGIDIKPYSQLPLIVGKDAPQHVRELMEILQQAPELASRFSAAVRVGERRWNIRLDGKIEVKLPENEPAQAWKRLAELQAKEQLLDRDVKVIDLRIEDRLFIKLAPDVQPQKAGSARET
jgi:cell division protein FtsQ